MRTTTLLSNQLMHQAKQHARATNRTLTQSIQVALIVLMARENAQRGDLTTFRGNGLHDGIDISSNTHLQDVMDTLR